jgi:predicted Zn-dependent protease
MLLTEKEASAICEEVLSFVKADDAEVSVESQDDSHLRFAANAFRTSGRNEDATVGLTVWVDKRKASSSTNEVDSVSLRALAEQAEQFARVSPVDPEYLPTLDRQRYRPVQGYVEGTVNVSPRDRARALAAVIAECEKENILGAGFHQALGRTTASATKHGNFWSNRSSLTSLSVTARTAQGNGSGYFLRSHFDRAKLDIHRISREAIQKALRSREPQALSPGIYTVILEPQAVADLLGYFVYEFDARSADEGRSPFSAAGGKTKVGEKIFDERLNLYSDPWHPELPGSPAAEDGIPAEKFYLVRNGALQTLVYSRYWGEKQHKAPTPGPVNVILESAAPPVSLEEMLAKTSKGLLVSRFWYIRELDPRTAAATGLTRDGVWLIENGRIRYPVRNFRFNQSRLELLAPGNVEEVGPSERVGSSEAHGARAGLFPALKVKEFHFTSGSEAV